PEIHLRRRLGRLLVPLRRRLRTRRSAEGKRQPHHEPRPGSHWRVVPRNHDTVQQRGSLALYKYPVDPAVLPILMCPRCRTAAPFSHLRNPRCNACGLEPQTQRHGVLDLIDVAIGGEPTAASTEQRLMESELVARVYERVWRPTFVRMLAGKG